MYRYNCHWEAKDIVVEAIEVKIVPPYKPDNLIGDAQAIDPIKKLVSIFLVPHVQFVWRSYSF